jgi:HEAT repeat protein
LAVDLLGDLRATEAIDILVRNLNETGQNGIVISLHYRPVASAIAAIGAPAIPRLIVALSDEDRGIRWEAASTLARIGSAAVNPLEEALSQDNADTKAGAALALTWIGGPEAEAAFKHAIETEMDPETLSKLKDALQEIHRRRGK